MDCKIEKIISVNRISSFRSQLIKTGKRLVVAPGYQLAVFGYFVAWEAEELLEDQQTWCYYPFAFFIREDDGTYQEVLNWIKDYITSQGN